MPYKGTEVANSAQTNWRRLPTGSGNIFTVKIINSLSQVEISIIQNRLVSASSLEVYDDEEFEYYDISHKPSTSSDEQLSKASNESDHVEEDDEKSLEIEDTSGHSDVEQLDEGEPGEPRVSVDGENEGGYSIVPWDFLVSPYRLPIRRSTSV